MLDLHTIAIYIPNDVRVNFVIFQLLSIVLTVLYFAGYALIKDDSGLLLQLDPMG